MDAYGRQIVKYAKPPTTLPKRRRSMFAFGGPTGVIDIAWALRNSAQVGPQRRCEGSMPCGRRIAQALDGASRTPMAASSPWIRRYPQVGFSFARRSTNWTVPPASPGRSDRCWELRPSVTHQNLMPPQQGLGPDEEPSPMVSPKEPAQPGEDRSVSWPERGTCYLAARHRDLVSEQDDFDASSSRSFR